MQNQYMLTKKVTQTWWRFQHSQNSISTHIRICYQISFQVGQVDSLWQSSKAWQRLLNQPGLVHQSSLLLQCSILRWLIHNNRRRTLPREFLWMLKERLPFQYKLPASMVSKCAPLKWDLTGQSVWLSVPLLCNSDYCHYCILQQCWCQKFSQLRRSGLPFKSWRKWRDCLHTGR